MFRNEIEKSGGIQSENLNGDYPDALHETYPCERILGLAQGYATMLADGKRMKAVGIDAWIAEQEERRKAGFAYADIRCYPYEVPDK